MRIFSDISLSYEHLLAKRYCSNYLKSTRKYTRSAVVRRSKYSPNTPCRYDYNNGGRPSITHDDTLCPTNLEAAFLDNGEGENAERCVYGEISTHDV